MTKKVLHILWDTEFGGIERLVHHLIVEQLKFSAFLPSILIAKKSKPINWKFESNQGIEAYYMNFTSGFDWNKANQKETLKVFNQHQLLHFHFFNPILFHLAQKSTASIIFTEHGNFGFGRKKRINDQILDLLKTYFLNKKGVFLIFNSTFSHKIAQKRYLKESNQNYQIVPNGIDLSDSERVMNSTESAAKIQSLKSRLANKTVIGTASRFARVKRIDRLIQAFSTLEHKENLVLLLIGDGPLKEDYKSLSKKLGIEEHLIFTGYLKEALDALQLVDICVLPSQNEAFGLVAVEALSLGKPTLVFKDGGGVVEIIENMEKNDIVPNEEGLANRMKFYLEHPEERDKRKEERIKYSQNYSIQKMALQVKNIYSDLV